MIEALLTYLGLGLLVAYGNDTLVVRDHVGGRLERFNFALRATLAWPTYILEDAVVYWGGPDEDA